MQPDLFASPPKPPADPAFIAIVRQQLQAALALVQSYRDSDPPSLMPLIHADNTFKTTRHLLPPEEADALWTAFDREMDALYARLNEGKEQAED